MIAHRFRALGWVAGIASAATGLYLISLQVAAERAKLEDVDRRIAAAHRDMRQLQTELGTRANMRQLEKWNDDVLALSAPRAEQYLHGEAQLASLSTEQPSALPSAAVPRAVLVAASPARTTAVAEPRLIPAVASRVEMPRGALQHIAFVTSAARPSHIAVTERTVIDRQTLGDLVRTAAVERGTRP